MLYVDADETLETVKEGSMKTRHLLVAAFSMVVGLGTAGMAQAQAPSPDDPVVSFEAGDRPGNFFTCSNTANSKSIGCVPGSIGGAQERSLAVIAPGETVGFPTFSAEASTIHTALSLIWPDGAPTRPKDVPPTEGDNLMPFKAAIDFLHPASGGVATVKLTEPGLYVFICDIHVYMFAAVIVDDPNTPDKEHLGLDLGKKITLVNGVTVPTYSDLAIRLLRTFFIITDPGNWKDYTKNSWTPTFPAVPVIVHDVNGNRIDVADLSAVLSIGTVDLTDSANKLFKPTTAAVGEIWVDTQFELTAGKSKPGTATAIDGKTWALTKKIALPETNMNHPHNMWTDRDQKVIYQTQWFDERVAVFDRKTGALIRELNAGPAPSHVMTRANNDLVHVAQNGGNNVREFNDLAGSGGAGPNQFLRDIPMTDPKLPTPDNSNIHEATHPHGHWMSSTGNEMVTPNENVNSSTVYHFSGGFETSIPTGAVPIATGMMPDSSKYYVANFLDSTISVINMANNNNTEIKKINLIEKYNPVEGCYSPTNPTSTPDLDCSFVGALPIQTPVSPDGTNMVTANTLTATITVVDTRPGSTEDTVVATLPCDPGCHGVQYGAKQGGGYYAYVANKFSNAMIIVDPDPNGDGNPIDAAIVGRVLLAGSPAGKQAVQDDTVIGNKGMGGQGVLAVPNVYNGWVQQWVKNCKGTDCNNWKKQLSSKQKNPGPVQ
jgi:DNA-binding beta-propeller fold protein YncE/plastocyanin